MALLWHEPAVHAVAQMDKRSGILTLFDLEEGALYRASLGTGRLVMNQDVGDHN
jgi:hypothetical protein